MSEWIEKICSVYPLLLELPSYCLLGLCLNALSFKKQALIQFASSEGLICMTALGYEDYQILTGTRGWQVLGSTETRRGTRARTTGPRTVIVYFSPHVLVPGAPPCHHGDCPSILVLRWNSHKLIQAHSFHGIRPPATPRALLLSVDFSSVSLSSPKPIITLFITSNSYSCFQNFLHSRS